jgi:hypothetical protein
MRIPLGGPCALAARCVSLPPLPEGRLEPAGDEDVERGGGFAAAVLEVVRDAGRDADERAMLQESTRPPFTSRV